MTPIELESLMASLQPAEKAAFDRWLFEQSWQSWTQALFPRTMHDFADHHEALWNWLWNLPPDSPNPFAAIWPRGGAKSTNAEIGVVMAGARGLRRYCLYVCATQDQADDHVANIAGLLEHPTLAATYPGMSEPLLGKFGPKGWRHNRLRTASGFTVDAIGMDKAARGSKLEDYRPDMMVFDDIDSEQDSPGGTQKKIDQMTRKLLPAGAANLAVLLVQNLVHEDSIFSRLAGVSDEKADFLEGCIVSGPFPALYDAVFQEGEDGKWHIIDGRPSWNGQSLAACRSLMKKIGYTAFLVECQQMVQSLPGGMFDHVRFKYVASTAVPPLIRVAVWVDPAITSTDKSDKQAIQVDGLGGDGLIYRLFSWEERSTPLATLMLGLRLCVQYGATAMGIETDQGGETWISVYDEAVRFLLEGYYDENNDWVNGGLDVSGIALIEQKASGLGSAPKVLRAQQMLGAYEEDRFRHVIGSHFVLEKSLRRFPRQKPYDLVDAAFWAWFDLDGNQPFTTAVAGASTSRAGQNNMANMTPFRAAMQGNPKWP